MKSLYEESGFGVTAVPLAASAPSTPLWVTFQLEFNSEPWGANLKNKPSTPKQILGTSGDRKAVSQETPAQARPG